MQKEEIIINGITALEYKGLKNILGEGNVYINESDTEKNQHNEPMLIVAGIIVSSNVLAALTIIFTKEIKTTTRTTRILTTSEGEIETTKTEISEVITESKPADIEVIKSICELFKVDISALAGIFKSE